MAENPYPASDRAKEIVKKSMTMDTLLSIAGPAGAQIRDEQYHPYLDDCMATGFKVIGLCPSADSGMHTFMDSLKAWEWHLSKLNERPDKYKIVRTAKDIREAVAEGKLAITLVHQGIQAFEQDFDRIGIMRQLGFGYCLLVYNSRDITGDGCMVKDNGGLTGFGQVLVKAYNKWGMIVDVTHVGERTSLDAIEVSSQPVISSHSPAYAVAPYARCISDERLKAIAQSGGVSSINMCGYMLDLSNPDFVTTDMIFRHIDHMVQLVGPDYVGLGSDYIPDTTMTVALSAAHPEIYDDNGYTVAAGLKGFPTPRPPDVYPAIVDKFLEHGYSEEDCGKILGGNMMRVFEQVWY